MFMETKTLDTLPLIGCGDGAPWSDHWENIHLFQVRYAVRRHFIEVNGKTKTRFYIYDKVKGEIPKWAEVMFIERTYAIGTLQKYLLSLSARTISALVSEWQKSELTFTERSKTCLSYPK